MKKLLFTLFLLLGICTVKAQTSLVGSTADSPVAVENGGAYLLPTDFSVSYFKYTSEEDGLLYLKMSQAIRIFSVSENGDNIGPLPMFGTDCVKGIRAGETCYFQTATTWGATVTMDVAFEEGRPYLPVSVTSVTPEEGAVYRTTVKEGSVTFLFNVEVNVAAIQATVVLPDGEQVRVNDYQAGEDYTTQGTVYTLLLANTYNQLLESGKLKAGDSFSVQLAGIADKNNPENVYEGTASVNYIASPAAVKLLGADNTTSLKSYYMPGDEEGNVSISFSGNVTCSAENAVLSYGDREAGTWVELPVPYTIKGNVVVWHLQGIQLSKAPLDDNGQRIVNISLKNICDEGGYPVQGNAVGSTGTVVYSYPVENVDVNIYPDFLPATGSNIDKVKELEIWISEGKYLTFDGVKVSYLKNGEPVDTLLSLEQLRVEDDPMGEKDLLVYVPLEGLYFDAGEVTVELVNVFAADGSSPVIKGVFKSEGKTDPSRMAEVTDGVAFPKVYYRMDGTPVDTPSSEGVYIQKMTDGQVRKVVVRR